MGRLRGLAALFTLSLTGVVLLGHYHLGFSGTTVQEAIFNLLSGLAQGPVFSWDNIPTAKELKWHACYDAGLQCARLEVPLDYSDPDGRKASIALIRKPADVPQESAFYRGPVLFNPGGPGGSGVDLIKQAAGNFSTILGPQFDIVGFDPRGISRSTPAASFFKTKADRAMWFGGLQGLPIANNTDEGVARTWARATLINKLAAETDDGYLRHINTENTARDMMSIVEAHGRDKIQYWGFSYGSILGTMFASLFPDKIERLIVDGVVDSDSYYNTGWSNDLMDADKVMDSFYTGCAAAGPSACAFWAPTASQIHANLTNLISTIRSEPVPMRTKSGYGLLDYAMLRGVLFSGLYRPYESFPVLAEGFAELAGGDGKKLFDRMSPKAFRCECDGTGPGDVESLLEASYAVLCNDALDVPGDLAWADEYFERMMEESSWSDLWASLRLGCINWPKFPKPFLGPFVANTSHPILFIGNTADPVTSLWAAKKMSKGYKDAVVLTQDSAGHCSLSAPSVCTQKYVRDYFIDGTLPEPGTVCHPVTSPFPTKGDQALVSALTLEDQEIFAAVSALSLDNGIVGPFSIRNVKSKARDAL